MKFTLLLLSLFAINTFACIPCDKDASVIVFKKAIPKFPPGFYGKNEYGYVRIILKDLGKKDLGMSIVSLKPDNTPKEVIEKMLEKYSFKIILKERHHAACVKNVELEIEFPLPQKQDNDYELDLKVPKIEIKTTPLLF